MTPTQENLNRIKSELPPQVTLVAVSKTHPPERIREAYDTGHRIFGENKVQELCAKYEALPKDIQWHMIGHLQSNKVKYIVPFVSLIHGVDSVKLLQVIEKEAGKQGRTVECLLQVYIAMEEAKFGLSENEIDLAMAQGVFRDLKYVKIRGLMGMASNTDHQEQVRAEFRHLKSLFERLRQSGEWGSEFSILSMGMSGDYQIAIEEGSSMVRIGSSIFGSRAAL